MDIGTPIKFHDCYSMVNDTGWWGARASASARVHSARAMHVHYAYA